MQMIFTLIIQKSILKTKETHIKYHLPFDISVFHFKDKCRIMQMTEFAVKQCSASAVHGFLVHVCVC